MYYYFILFTFRLSLDGVCTSPDTVVYRPVYSERLRKKYLEVYGRK